MLCYSQRRVDKLHLGGNPLDVIFEELVGICPGYYSSAAVNCICLESLDGCESESHK